MTAARHFLDIDAVSKADLRQILDLARDAKTDRAVIGRPMEGKTLAMIFDRPSTRTRVSFEVAAHQLGGQAIVLSSR
ncbi:MAG: ornithine carbamoyltransferase, partial [Pseudomonadota bacterium]